MARNKSTPTASSNWAKNFGKSTVRTTGNILKTVTPNMINTSQNISASIKENRDFITQTRSSMKVQQSYIDKTEMGIKSKNLIKDAMRDVRSGNFALDRINSDTTDGFNDDIDALMYETGDSDIEIQTETDKSAMSSRELRLLSKVTASSSLASTESMKTMTNTLSSVTIKAGQANTNILANITNLGFNRLSSEVRETNLGIKAINNNLVQLINFQNNNMSITNQAAIDYYESSSNMLNKIGENLSYMRDIMEQRETSTKKQKSFSFDANDFMFGGFNPKEYANMVKNNFNNSLLGIVPMMLSMNTPSDQKPLEKAFEMGLKKVLFPKKLSKSLNRADTNFNRLIENAFLGIGDLSERYDNPLLQMFGEIFGKKRGKVNNINLGDYTRGSMSWNGIAQKTLVEVIPSYLANIEKAVTKANETRHFDYDTGLFKSNETLMKEFNNSFESNISFAMSSVIDKINNRIDKLGMTDEKARVQKDRINNLVNQRINDGSGITQEYQNSMVEILNKTMPVNEVHNVMMDFEESIRDAIKSINSFSKDIQEETNGSVYKNLFNNDSSVFKKAKEAKVDYFQNSLSFNMLRDLGLDINSTPEEVEKARLKKQKQDELSKKWLSRFKTKTTNRGARAASVVDSVDSKMYDLNMRMMLGKGTTRTYNAPADEYEIDRAYADMKKNGMFGKGNSTPSSDKASTGKATSRASKSNKASTDVSKNIADFKNMNLDKELNAKDSQIENDIRKTGKMMDDMKPEPNEDQNSLKAFITGLYTTFMHPVSKLLNSGGFVTNMMKNEEFKKNVNKVKDKLFNEKTGMFSNITLAMQDGANAFKHVFTGKEYKDRTGKVHKSTDDSVMGHIRNGYDFVFRNTMTYLFGDNYKENEKYKKYASWADFKGKHILKQQKKEEANKQTEAEKDTTATQPNTSSSTQFMKMNLQKFADDTADESKFEKAFRVHIEDPLKDAGNNVKHRSEEFMNEYFGRNNDEAGKKQEREKSQKSFLSKMKGSLPKTIAAGLAGASVVALTGGSVGLLGSLFLPTGIVGGALAGVGISLAAQSEKFRETMFGKDEDGQRTGGLISKSLQASFKKSLPLIVGGATLGAIKTVIKGHVASGPLGVVTSALLPGGVVGGALLGTGVALLKNNDKINSILFGKKKGNEDGHAGILSKGYSKVTDGIGKLGKGFKNGLKGLGIGALAGATIGNMGVIGSAMTLGGPIGAGIAGLGIGIASSTKRFNELLFGTKEIGDDGQPTGKVIKNGLFDKFRSMISVNLLEPVKLRLGRAVTEMAYWTKEKISIPFDLTIGPVLDSFTRAKEDLFEFMKDKFNKVTDRVGHFLNETTKKIFSPFTRLLGMMFNAGIGAAKGAFKLTGSAIAAPLNLLSFAMSGKRRKEYGIWAKDSLSLAGDAYGILRDKWNNDDEKYRGIKGQFRKVKNRLSDVKEAYTVGREGYNAAMTEGGYNHRNWRGAGAAKRQLRKDRKEDMAEYDNEEKLLKLRQQYSKADGYKERSLRDSEFKKRQKAYAKYGVTINDRDELYNYTQRNSEWRANNQQTESTKKTEKYQDTMVGWMQRMYDLFAGKGAQTVMNKNLDKANKKKYSTKKVQKLNRQFKKKFGKNLSQMGINMDQITDYESLPPYAWEEYAGSEEFDRGDLEGWMRKYGGKYIGTDNEYDDSEFYDNNIDDSTYGNTVRERMQRAMGKYNVFNKHKAPSKRKYGSVPMNLQRFASDEPSNGSVVKAVNKVTDAILQNTEVSTGGKYDTSDFKKGKLMTDTEVEKMHQTSTTASGKQMKNAFSDAMSEMREKEQEEQADQERENKEASETEKARGLKGKLNSFFSKFGVSADTVDNETDSEKNESKKGFFSKILGFGTSIISVLGSLLTNPKVLIAATAGLMASSKYKDQITDLAGNVMSYAAENIPKVLGTITDLLVDKLPSIIGGTAKGAWNAAKSVGNFALEKLGLKNEEETVDAEQAQELIDQGYNVYDNGDGTYGYVQNQTYYDQDGNVQTIGQNVAGSVGRTVFNQAVGYSNKTVNSFFKNGMKVAGAVTTAPLSVIPGGKAAVKGAKVIGKAASSSIKKATSNVSRTKLVEIAKSFIKKLSSLVKGGATKIFGEETIAKLVDRFSTSALKTIGSASEEVAEAGLKKFAKGAAQGVVKGVTKFIPFIGVGLSAYDAISGGFEAEYLFDVQSDAVDGTMVGISAFMKFILGLGIGPVFDILLEVLGDISSVDFKKELAVLWYSCIMEIFGDPKNIDKLKANQSIFELEAEEYNKDTGSNLSAADYSDLKKKNQKWYKRAWNYLTGKKNANYDDYEKAAKEAYASGAYSTTEDTSNVVTADTSSYGWNRNTNSVGYGKNRIGLGTPNSQSDPRWANYTLGQFKDGGISTMESGGCGPTALSTVLKTTGKNISPVAAAEYAKSNGYISDGGANAGLFTDGASKLGLKANNVSSSSLRSELESGKPVIVAGKANSGSSVYTQAGHIMAVKGVQGNDAIVNDPTYGTDRKVSLGKLTNGMTHAWSYDSVGYGIGPTYKEPAINMTSNNATAVSSTAYVTNKAGKKMSRVGYITADGKACVYIKKKGAYYQQKATAQDYADAKESGSPIYGSTSTTATSTSTTRTTSSNNGVLPSDPSKTNPLVSSLLNSGITKSVSSVVSESQLLKETIEKAAQTIPAGTVKPTIDLTDPNAYIGLTVAQIKLLANMYKDQLGLYPILGTLFNLYKGSSNGKTITDSDLLATSEYASLNEALGVSSLGETGINYKNGIPFYMQADPLWGSLKWRKDGTIATTGDDITSFAMGLSAYSNNAITPKYIKNEWLDKDNPEWYDSDTGLTDAIFQNGGANAKLETQNGSGRLKVERVRDPKTAIEAMKQKRLVYMNGYQYSDSPFGGIGDAKQITSDSPTHTVIGTYSNSGVMAVNDPTTDVNSYSYFPNTVLTSKIGMKGDLNPLKDAFIISNSDGSGLAQNVDTASMIQAKSQFESVADADGVFGKMKAGLGNFTSVIENLLKMLVNGGKYQSIFDETFDSMGYDAGDVTGLAYAEDSTATAGSASQTPTAQEMYAAAVKKDQEYSQKSGKTFTDPADNHSYNTTTKYNPTTKTQTAVTPSSNDLNKTNTAKYVPTASNKTNPYYDSNGQYRLLTDKELAEIAYNNSFSGGVNNAIKNSNLGGLSAALKSKTTTTKKKTTKNVSSKANRVTGYGYSAKNSLLKLLFGIENSSEIAANADGTTDVDTDYSRPTSTSGVNGDYIGRYVKQFESGNNGPATVSGGSGDYGGASFGSYQLASFGRAVATGQLKNFWDRYYKNQYPYVTPGANTAFIEAWKSAARQDPTGFHSKEHQFMFDNYYKPQKNKIGGVLDPDTHSRAAQESIWSSAIQYGPNSSIITEALGGRNSQNASVVSLIKAIQDYKTNTVSSKFSRSSIDVQNGVRNRHNITERAVLNSIANLAPLSAIGGGNSSLQTLVRRSGVGISADKAKAIGFGTQEDTIRAKIVEYAKTFLGKLRYSQANRNIASGSGDCSSFVQYVYKQVCGIDVGSNTSVQISSSAGTDCDTMSGNPNYNNLLPGDLLFFSRPGSTYSGNVGHVEIYIGNGQTIGHGGPGAGPTIKSLDTSSLKNRYIKARRYVGSNTTLNSNYSSNTTSANSTQTSGVSGLFGNLFSSMTNISENLVSTSMGGDPSSILTGSASAMESTLQQSIGNGSGKTDAEKWFTNTLNGSVTSRYGLGYGIGNQFHRGIDVGAAYGTDVKTPVGGEVVASGNDPLGYGNHVVIRDNKGVNHIFGHLSQVGFGQGDKVNAATVIGKVGSSGKSTGSHLHYEMRRGDGQYSSIDPASYRYDTQTNSYNDNPDMGIGGGNKDIKTTTQDKINIVLKTGSVEEKMNAILEVLSSIASNTSNQTQATTTNNINNIGYGSGKEQSSGKTVVVNKGQKSQVDMSKRKIKDIHDSIAKTKA